MLVSLLLRSRMQNRQDEEKKEDLVMEKGSFFQTTKGTLANTSMQEEKNALVILLGCE